MDKGTVTVSSGDNILAGLNLRASFERKDRRLPRPCYDADAIGRARLRRRSRSATTSTTSADPPAQLIDSPELASVPFLTANTDFSAELALAPLRAKGRIADSTVVTKGGQQVGVIGVTTPIRTSPRPAPT